MLRLLKVFLPSADKDLPEPVLVELIELMFSASLSPIRSITVAVLVTTVLISGTGHDVLTLLLGCAAILTNLGRVALVFAYRRQRPVPAGAMRLWERRFALGSYGFAMMLGLMDVRALSLNDPYAPMLICGQFFAYSSGLVMRISVRPTIGAVSLLIVSLLTGLGYVLLAAQQTVYIGIVYLSQVVLITGFIVIGFRSIAESYRTIVGQLMIKRDLIAISGQDPLTELPNRLSLRARFEELMAANQRAGTRVAFHCLDLDLFKAVNDTFGHPMGDALLQAVAKRLLRALKAGDTVARIGGDEFVVLQGGIREAAEAELLAHRIIRVVSAPYDIGGQMLNVGISAGIAMAPDDGAELERLLARADAALYLTKGQKRGGVAFWTAPVAEAVSTAA